MVFETPQWLWGAAFALIVPIIHLLGRRAIKPILIPSLMWLEQFKTQDRRRNKLKEWLLVLLRMLVIALFFLSLSGPRITRTTTTLLIDNSPALWSQKSIWLPAAIDELPKGTFTVHVRGGITLGLLRSDELEEALKDWPASTAPLQDFDEAILISTGFASLPEGAGAYYLPKRAPLFNGTISLVSENTREQSFAITNGPYKGVWEVRDSTQLVLQEFDSIVHIPWWSIATDELYLSHSADSILEDNMQLLRRPMRLPIIVLNAPAVPKLTAWTVDQQLTYTNATTLQQLPSEAIILLNGFSFIPEDLKKPDYVLLRIADETSEALEDGSLPNLDDPFYTAFFIGASERNRWPNPKQWSGTDLRHLQPLLQTADGNVLAGYQELANGSTIYEQAFPIADADHPYYKALLQWASSLQLKKEFTELLNYGEDHYIKNRMRLDTADLHYFEWTRTPLAVRKSVQFWTESKIALALALFCALIALIFAKI